MQGVKHSLTVGGTIMQDQNEEQGVDVLRKFLFQTSLNLQVKNSFDHVNLIRYKIARMYRDHVESLRNRANVMSRLFDTEIGYLVTYFSKKKKGAP